MLKDEYSESEEKNFDLQDSERSSGPGIAIKLGEKNRSQPFEGKIGFFKEFLSKNSKI